MTFTLTIELGNDAMRTCGDLARAVSAVGHKILVNSGGTQTPLADGGKIMDANGNSVGNWEVR